MRLLGEGGMGEAYLARQIGPENFEKLVVVKRLHRELLRSQTTRDLFLAEARIAARLNHANIVQIYDLDRVGDEYFIAMEYVNGIDLGRALELSRRLNLYWPVEIICKVVANLCIALQAAHSHVDELGHLRPIIHRDVSPSNVLLSVDGGVKLADFGIAFMSGESGGERSGKFMGKADYAAPEQKWPDEFPNEIDSRSDVFGAGVILYECLTLRPLFLSGYPSSTAGTDTPPPQIAISRGGVPPLLQDIFERAVKVDSAERYQTAREFGRDLERITRSTHTVSGEDLASWVRRLLKLLQEHDTGHPGERVTDPGSPRPLWSQDAQFSNPAGGKKQ
jgi:serine/threonine-protein kinase